MIDVTFESIYKKYPELDPNLEGAHTNRFTFISQISTEEQSEKREHVDFEPILTMGTFEAARAEVCWNIFNSVYPKFVDLYSHLSPP